MYVSNPLHFIFWEQNGVVLIDYLVRNTTITSIYYASFLLQLRKFNKDILQGNAPSTTPTFQKWNHVPLPTKFFFFSFLFYFPCVVLSVFRPFSSSWIIFEIRLIHNDDAQINEVKSEHAVFYKKDHHKCIKW